MMLNNSLIQKLHSDSHSTDLTVDYQDLSTLKVMINASYGNSTSNYGKLPHKLKTGNRKPENRKGRIS